MTFGGKKSAAWAVAFSPLGKFPGFYCHIVMDSFILLINKISLVKIRKGHGDNVGLVVSHISVSSDVAFQIFAAKQDNRGGGTRFEMEGGD